MHGEVSASGVAHRHGCFCRYPHSFSIAQRPLQTPIVYCGGRWSQSLVSASPFFHNFSTKIPVIVQGLPSTLSILLSFVHCQYMRHRRPHRCFITYFPNQKKGKYFFNNANNLASKVWSHIYMFYFTDRSVKTFGIYNFIHQSVLCSGPAPIFDFPEYLHNSLQGLFGYQFFGQLALGRKKFWSCPIKLFSQNFIIVHLRGRNLDQKNL